MQLLFRIVEVKIIVLLKNVRNVSKLNKLKFQLALSLIKWSSIEMYEDPDFVMSLFHGVLFLFSISAFLGSRIAILHRSRSR